MKQQQGLSSFKKVEKALIVKLAKKKKEITQAEEELLLVRRMIRKMGGKTSSAKGTGIIASIPKVYSMQMHQEKKVLYVLEKLKEASVKEITDYMCNLEKSFDRDAIYRRVQQVINKMKNEDKIISSGDYASKFKINI